MKKSIFIVACLAITTTNFGQNFVEIVQSGNYDDLQQFLENNKNNPDFNIDQKWPTRGPTALWHAIYTKQYSLIKLLLDHGANPNFISGGVSPLWRTVVDGQYETSKLLLAYGADPNFYGHNGRTLIWWAVSYKDYPTIHLLLKYGADPFKKPGKNETAYELAKQKKLDNIVHLFDTYQQKKEDAKKRTQTTYKKTKNIGFTFE